MLSVAQMVGQRTHMHRQQMSEQRNIFKHEQVSRVQLHVCHMLTALCTPNHACCRQFQSHQPDWQVGEECGCSHRRMHLIEMEL